MFAAVSSTPLIISSAGTVNCENAQPNKMIATQAPQTSHRKLGKSHSLREIFGMAFIVNSQLFAGVNAIVSICNDFQPDFRRASMVTTTSALRISKLME